jgi:hypothetical protein
MQAAFVFQPLVDANRNLRAQTIVPGIYGSAQPGGSQRRRRAVFSDPLDAAPLDRA